jgi:hypothetical protein
MASLSTDIKEQIDNALSMWLEKEQEGNAFPCDFDLVWKWAGYTRKDTAKSALIRLCKEGSDYCQNGFPFQTGKPLGGRPAQTISLTRNAAKHVLMQAGTIQGSAVREYFIEAESKWRLLTTNLANGRLRLEDKVTGQVIDNPLEDPVYVERRLAAADAFTQRTTYMAAVCPELNPSHHRRVSAMASKVSLGDNPKAVLVKRGFLKKRLNKKNNMTYPSRPNGRDIMDGDQLSITRGCEGIFTRLLKKYGNYELAMAEYEKVCESIGAGCSILHKSCLALPTKLEEVRDASGEGLLT